jgi:hypothetical protein
VGAATAAVRSSVGRSIRRRYGAPSGRTIGIAPRT